jgi:hypothetical protein
MLPTEFIADYAQLLAGRRLGPGGALLPIPARELAELGRLLRGQHPELFTVTLEERRAGIDANSRIRRASHAFGRTPYIWSN